MDRIVKAVADPGRVTPGYLCGGLTNPKSKKPVVHHLVPFLLPFSDPGDRGFDSCLGTRLFWFYFFLFSSFRLIIVQC